MTAVPAPPRLLPLGDAALSVEFGDAIDPAVTARVLALDAALRGREIPGLVETVPTYRALTLHLDPLAADAEGIARLVAGLLAERAVGGAAEGAPPAPAGRCWRVPVVYGGGFGPDLAEVADRLGLPAAEVVRRHAAPRYTVAMLGFMPGFAYLAGLDPALAVPRRATPRAEVPAGSVAIGGAQTAVFSLAAPSGWHLIGRTPARAFDPARDPPFLFAPGDRLRFVPVAEAAWDTAAALAEASP